MQIVKTLPDLPLFGAWCRNPSTERWLPTSVAVIDIANPLRALMGQPPLETGEPASGETVWTGDGFAVYQP